MGRINVEGLGVVEIAGDEPTAEEISIITDNYKNQLASKETDKFVDSPNFGRIALEVGLSIVGSVATGGLLLPGLAVRAGMLARPFLLQLLKSSAGSAVGGGFGAAAAQTFDPKDNMVKEITRASIEGALGEAVGAPIGIAVVNKLTAKLSPKLAQIDSATAAEEILKKQKEKILASPEKYSKSLVEGAQIAMIPPALKTDNRLIDIAQNIAEKSILGGREILIPKQATQKVIESALEDFVAPIINNTDATQTGRLFIDALVDSKELFKAQAKTNYTMLDQEIVKLGNSKVVNITKYNEALQKELDSLAKGGVNTPTAKDLLTRNIYKNKDGKFINKVTFSEANNLRSDILALGRNLPKEDMAAYKTAQKLIADKLTSSIDEAAVPDALKNVYKKANTFYREGLESYNTTIMKQILSKEDGKDAFKVIITGGDKGETVEATLNQINKIFKDKPAKIQELKSSLQGTVLDDMMKKIIVPDAQYGTKLSPDKMDGFIKNKRETFEKLFDETEMRQIKKLQEALSVAYGKLSKEGGLPGGVFIQLTQGAAVGSLLAFNQDSSSIATAAGIIVGPKVVAKMLVNPKFNKFLFEGLTANNGTKAGIAFRQLVGRLINDNLIPEAEGKAAIENSKKKKQQPITTSEQPATEPQPVKIPPINTNVTDIQNRPVAEPMPISPGAMPTGDLQERITQSNQLDQFIPVR